MSETSSGDRSASQKFFRARGWHAGSLSGYSVALASVGAATSMRILLDPILGEHHPFTLYFAAVAVTSWYGGFGPGVLALLLSYFAADWFFIAPRFEFNWPHSNLDEFIALIAFLFTGLAIAVTSQLARNALVKARQRQAELETQIAERRHAEEALRKAEVQLRTYATELELRVEERTAHLQETIRSLEGVCYHIAHDLRAPLRAMEGYTSILLEHRPAGIDPARQHYLERINDSATQMDRLLHGLLEYGRLGHTHFEVVSTDPRRSLNDILELLDPAVRQSQASIRISGRWPVVVGNPELLRVVFENLLRNALKFVHPDQAPFVEITAEVEGTRARFSVQDNGIGIPEGLAHKAFQIFEKLHSDQRFQGTGIGLALAAKAVELMNGRIGVHPNSLLGATFWFELPLAPQNGVTPVQTRAAPALQTAHA